MSLDSCRYERTRASPARKSLAIQVILAVEFDTGGFKHEKRVKLAQAMMTKTGESSPDAAVM